MGTHSCAQSTARRIRILARPSGRRSPLRLNPEVRNRARASRRSAVSFFTRRRSFSTSCWSSEALKFVTSRLTTTVGAAKPPARRRARDSEVGGDGHVPGALDETPKPVIVALLRAGRGRHGHDHRPFPHGAQLLETTGGVHRRDDNSRGRVQDVRGGSSGPRHHPTTHATAIPTALYPYLIR